MITRNIPITCPLCKGSGKHGENEVTYIDLKPDDVLQEGDEWRWDFMEIWRVLSDHSNGRKVSDFHKNYSFRRPVKKEPVCPVCNGNRIIWATETETQPFDYNYPWYTPYKPLEPCPWPYDKSPYGTWIYNDTKLTPMNTTKPASAECINNDAPVPNFGF